MGSVLLVPDFYCIDVTDNIRAHGYTVGFYPLDDHFHIDETTLIAHIHKHKPAVLIVFHACGITGVPTSVMHRILRKHPRLLCIEDAVQRLVEPGSVRLISPRHYLIDSLRKVSPLPGSFLYQHTEAPAIRPEHMRREWEYVLLAAFYYVVFAVLNTVGSVTRNPRLIRYAIEEILGAHDDIIGDSVHGYAGNPILPILHRHFDFRKIRRMKEVQTKRYDTRLAGLFRCYPMWYGFRIPKDETGILHAFPLGLIHPQLPLVMKYIQSKLHDRGIPVWFKFPDSPWSSTRGVLYLPLGFHMTPTDIRYIADTLEDISGGIPIIPVRIPDGV